MAFSVSTKSRRDSEADPALQIARRRKYLYKYIQMRHREKTKQKQNNNKKTVILLLIKIMNNYDNKNDKIR